LRRIAPNPTFERCGSGAPLDPGLGADRRFSTPGASLPLGGRLRGADLLSYQRLQLIRVRVPARIAGHEGGWFGRPWSGLACE
jgi:hypothetical protein